MERKTDRRLVKRREKARLVKKPEGLSLNRRVGESAPTEGLTSAVVAALMLGQPAAIVAQRFGLHPSTVLKWQEAFDISGPLKRRDQLSEMMLVFIEQELASLMTISMVTSKEEWIMGQDAGELAMFVSAKQDRMMQILAAYSKAQASRQAIQGQIVNEQGD